MNEFTPSQLARMDTDRLATYRTNLDFYNGSQWPTHAHATASSCLIMPRSP